MIDINWSLVGMHSITLAAAYVLALPIALNREAKARGAGLRTFPLVSIAACGFVLIGIDIFDGSDAEARVVSGIITGIGFIGGGAILKNDNKVSGTATAASIWATGAIGIAAAYSRYEVALLISVITFFTLHFGYNAKKVVKESDVETEEKC
ncbi:MgtC/SapB family protein [Kangiella aquimarina]|uniref:Protein MgtC n=1 Tax=Kangiella aquimarina TaxID=261965 RepID=A0ABZ0X277_9GAMM|nr:MgtC/SapB family protein [Kangiella aquimarina]WQG84483.1 MgtC/SapB family protein [Kangiella aquimarina]